VYVFVCVYMCLVCAYMCVCICVKSRHAQSVFLCACVCACVYTGPVNACVYVSYMYCVSACLYVFISGTLKQFELCVYVCVHSF
jgi:hypothetical protein